MLIASESARTARRPTLPPTAPANVATLFDFGRGAGLADMMTGVAEWQDGGREEERRRGARGVWRRGEYKTKERIKSE